MAMIYRNIVRSFSFKRNVYLQNAVFRKILPCAQIHCSRILFKSQEIKMPSLSPTMTEGTIVKWLKNEGDSFSPGDILCEIQTDKAIVGFEVDEEGILAKILKPDDSKDVQIGTVIAVMVDADDDWKSAQVPTKPVSDGTTTTPAPISAKPTSGIQGIPIKMPSLSPTMTEGTIVKWLKKEGESFSPGEALCEIQTDKAVVAFEVEEDGILAKILVPEDTKDIQLGTVIAIMVNEGEDWQNVSLPEDQAPGKPLAIDVGTAAPKAMQVASKVEEVSKLHGPSVKKLLAGYDIKYSIVTPTGPHDVLLKSDVLKYISSKSLKPKSGKEEKSTVVDSTAGGPEEEHESQDIPLTSMRKIIAKRLTESKTHIPHCYMSVDCLVKQVTSLRMQMKKEGVNVSVNDFIIKCAANALAQVPNVNVISHDGAPKKLESIDISIAVATENGLITPIIKRANTLSVPEISERVKQLAIKARAGRLRPDEFQGGSFSISNLGMFGISHFTAVINPPQGAILAVGTSRVEFGEGMKPQTKMTVTLSFDRQVIEEMDATNFLNSFRSHLEHPIAMMVDIPGIKIPEN